MGDKKDSMKPAQKDHSVSKTSKRMPKDKKLKLAMLILVICIIGSVFMQRLICSKWHGIAQKVFGLNEIKNKEDKMTVLKETILLMGVFEFVIAMTVMSMRILGHKINPVAEKDPLSIALLNRILSNNLEQSFVFFGLYSYLLLCHTSGNFPIKKDLEAKYVYGLPLLFLIGRVVYVVSYIATTLMRVSTIKAVGFAFSLVANLLILMELIFDQTTFMREFLFGG